jgi:class 3 adenylate cyclase
MEPRIDEGLLEHKLEEIEKARAWSPRLISKLEALLRAPDEAALSRINPLAFARDRGVPEAEAIALFLHGAKVGLFEMDWHLLCPSCGMAVESFTSLRKLHADYFCAICKRGGLAQLDDYIQVSFTVAARVRAIAHHDPEALPIERYILEHRFSREAHFGSLTGPRTADAFKSLTRAMGWLPPGETVRYELECPLGAISGGELIRHVGFALPVEGEPAGEPTQVHAVLTDHELTVDVEALRPGRVVLTVDNRTKARGALMVGHLTPEMVCEDSPLQFEPFLRGAQLLTNQTFRSLFRTEVIRGTDGIGIRDVTLLFTDLKGSTALYERIGDLKAFELVREHFDRLADVVQAHGGALVKTIGDAVMATFLTPADAVRAALRMLADIDTFNQEHGTRDVVLKIGVHRGASIAVTLNDNLDYFGQTVNIAARVQGLADADEIFLTDDVYAAPGVTAALGAIRVSAQDAHLRGIQKQVRVYKAALGTPH